MTIQKAAYQILVEVGHYLTSRELAKLALERGMAMSNARDPIQSLAQTIEKNIRDGVYNSPPLSFARNKNGQRVIGLPTWDIDVMTPSHVQPSMQTVEVTEETFGRIKLAREAGIGDSDAETLSKLVHAGFKVLKDEISSGLSRKLDKFG